MDISNMVEEVWRSGSVLKRSFQECRVCLKDIYAKTRVILKSPLGTPGEFIVEMDEIPEEFFSLRKNVFSTLFQSVYQILNIREERRILYGKFNHLFRAWVTSADNLLDSEDKIVIPVRMPGSSRIMSQVISTMVADRVMKRVLEDAQARGIISQTDSDILSDRSLQLLLPAAAEEASEENGITRRPKPCYVLYTVHRLKTGLLFHIPFLGPEAIEKKIDNSLLNNCKIALDKFGLGCQLLDDIRDMAKDYLGKRHNYVLSKIFWEERASYVLHLKKIRTKIDISSKIFSDFPEVVYPAAELAGDLLNEGLMLLGTAGLGIGKCNIEAMVLSMFKILDVEELLDYFNVENFRADKEG